MQSLELIILFWFSCLEQGRCVVFAFAEYVYQIYDMYTFNMIYHTMVYDYTALPQNEKISLWVSETSTCVKGSPPHPVSGVKDELFWPQKIRSETRASTLVINQQPVWWIYTCSYLTLPCPQIIHMSGKQIMRCGIGAPRVSIFLPIKFIKFMKQ